MYKTKKKQTNVSAAVAGSLPHGLSCCDAGCILLCARGDCAALTRYGPPIHMLPSLKSALPAHPLPVRLRDSDEEAPSLSPWWTVVSARGTIPPCCKRSCSRRTHGCHHEQCMAPSPLLYIRVDNPKE